MSTTAKGNGVRIEEDFYGRNLIDHPVKEGLINTYKIKYQLVADRSLRHDALAGYMVYLFDNFDEKTAKMLAYKFIGSLGTKYDKSSTRVSVQKQDEIFGSRTFAGKRPKAVPNLHLI